MKYTTNRQGLREICVHSLRAIIMINVLAFLTDSLADLLVFSECNVLLTGGLRTRWVNKHAAEGTAYFLNETA